MSKKARFATLNLNFSESDRYRNSDPSESDRYRKPFSAIALQTSFAQDQLQSSPQVELTFSFSELQIA